MIRILKCQSDMSWYKSYIGQEFRVIKELEYEFVVNGPDMDITYFVQKIDCRKI